MLNFSSLMVGSENPKKLADFYTKVFGEPTWADGDWFGFQVGDGHVTIGPHSEVKGRAKNPERLIINFETSEVKDEFVRIKDLGTKVIAEPYQMDAESDMWIATFADPDGNYFQLMSPWEENKPN